MREKREKGGVAGKNAETLAYFAVYYIGNEALRVSSGREKQLKVLCSTVL